MKSLSYPKERLLQHGVATLTLTDLIAVILGAGTRTNTVFTLAENAASALRSGVTSVQQLQLQAGLGVAQASQVIAALALSSSVQQQVIQPASPELFWQLTADIRSLPQEHVLVFILNLHGEVQQRHVISVGTLSASLIHPREVFRPAITASASAIVLAHTHPSGSQVASSADIEVTKNLVTAGRLLAIPLLDHCIITQKGAVSLRNSHPQLFLESTAQLC